MNMSLSLIILPLQCIYSAILLQPQCVVDQHFYYPATIFYASSLLELASACKYIRTHVMSQ